MTILTEEQKQAFWRDGVLVVRDAVTPTQLSALRKQFSDWVEESKQHTASYGECIDGRQRFDLQPGHTSEKPSLRRINAPTEASEAYFNVMSDSPMVDMIAELIGPNVRHHHNKINSKLPGTATKVDWHQDFPYPPHTNPDLVTALLMVDEVTEQNGPLEIVKESHKGPLHSLWHDGVFTGAVDQATAKDCLSNVTKCFGPAGSVCFMHTRVLHGSAPNHSDHPRTLFISVYAAADAVACAPNPVPNKHEGLLVRGKEPHKIRCTAYEVDVPEFPKQASFFAQQSQEERGH